MKDRQRVSAWLWVTSSARTEASPTVQVWTGCHCTVRSRVPAGSP